MNRFSAIDQAKKQTTAALKQWVAENGKEEYQHQCKVVELLELAGIPGLRFWHTPNASKVPVQYRVKLKAQGVRAGVPDLILAFPDKRMGYLELKAGKNPLTDQQKSFLSAMADAGHLTAWSNNFANTVAILEAWGAIRAKVAA